MIDVDSTIEDVLLDDLLDDRSPGIFVSSSVELEVRLQACGHTYVVPVMNPDGSVTERVFKCRGFRAVPVYTEVTV